MTDAEIQELRALCDAATRDADGFSGTFVFDAEHDEDRGVGNIADVVRVDDRLVYVPVDADVRDDECYTIADCVEQHVAEPLARMLNAVRPLAVALPAALDALEQVRKLLGEAARLLDGYDPLSVPGGWKTVDEVNERLAAIRKEAGIE